LIVEEQKNRRTEEHMIEAEEVESRGRLRLRRTLEPSDYKPSTCRGSEE
jgi:hypothetical protein